MTFEQWLTEMRAALVKRCGPDGDKWAGEAEDCRALFETGIAPDEAAGEIVYAAHACGCG